MNVFILTAMSTYIDTVDILRDNLDICGIIGLSNRESSDTLSGYFCYEQYCKEHEISFTSIDSYNLSNDIDKNNLLNLSIDVLVVVGWQRLIPEWLISHCRYCAIGAHGSSDGITMGRGRSPQNWALLLGKSEFYISIFRIDPGIDSGAIIDTKYFTYSIFDTIETSYYKVSWLTGDMLVEALKSKSFLQAKNLESQTGTIRYLPQRTPADGTIDWCRNTIDVHNFIRALTRPYPGAYSTTNKKQKITIWSGIPFNFEYNGKVFKTGEVVKLFHNGDLVIKTGDGFYLATSYTLDTPGSLVPGMVLESEPFTEQIERIVRRHYEKYPENIISEDITRYLPGDRDS